MTELIRYKIVVPNTRLLVDGEVLLGCCGLVGIEDVVSGYTIDYDTTDPVYNYRKMSYSEVHKNLEHWVFVQDGCTEEVPCQRPYKGVTYRLED